MQGSSPMAERRVGMFSTPTKPTSSKQQLPHSNHHSSTVSSINSSSDTAGNEENNGVPDPSLERYNKRSRTDRTPTKISSSRKKAIMEATKSECGPASSVTHLRGWLNDFSKQQGAGIPSSASKSAIVGNSAVDSTRNAAKSRFRSNREFQSKPPMAARPSPSSHVPSKGARIVDRPTTTPKNFRTINKPKIKKEEVQATDSGYASVAKLSEWLANDPTSHKKLRHVRKGRNIIAKSRQFEKDMEDVIVEENRIERGSVSDKKKWLQGAFHGESDDEQTVASEFRTQCAPRYTQSEVGGYREPPRINFPSPLPTRQGISSAQSEIIVDDSSSVMSVSAKKDWLKNAFKNSKSAGTPSPAPRAVSDVMHSRGESQDEVTAQAKQKWLERSARKAAGISTPASKTPAPTPIKQVSRTPAPTPTKLVSRTPAPPPIKQVSRTPVKFVSRTPTRDQERPSLEPAMSRDDDDTVVSRYDASVPSILSLGSSLEGGPSLLSGVSMESDYRESMDDKSFCSSKENATPAPIPVKPPSSWKDQAIEDCAPVDFRAARALLIQRSKDNGNELRLARKK